MLPFALRRDAAPLALLALAAAAGAVATPVVAQTPAPAAARATAGTGRLVGTVTDSAGRPLAAAQLRVVGTTLGALTDLDGRFRLDGVPAGSHALRVQRLGRAARVVAVAVREGADTRADVVLADDPTQLAGVVVSASRRVERVTEAPATVVQIPEARIAVTPGNSFLGALREVPGIDFIQTGMLNGSVNARGFNSSYNNRLLMMEDGRLAVMPESGLPVGLQTTNPRIDLASIEVLVGPGAALYGPDASNGVLTLRTKDPRRAPGTSVEVAGGSRGYHDVQFRTAGVRGRWGAKLTGELLGVRDFENRVPYAPATGQPASLPELGIDFSTRIERANASVVRYLHDGQVEVATGVSNMDGVQQTNIGRNQLQDWSYGFAQARLTTSRWFAQAYATRSQSGGSYATNRYTWNAAQPANAGLTAAQLRSISDWPADGRLYAAELQYNALFRRLASTRLTVGGQVRRDRVSSAREYMSDRVTNADIVIGQAGAYLQSETPLPGRLTAVLAARLDDHEYYDPQFSPKVALVWRPTDGQSVRATWNRAYRSPMTAMFHFNAYDFQGSALQGNREGLTLRNAARQVVGTVDPVQPEQNSTVELGWRGVLRDRLFVDVTGWAARYRNFLSPLFPIANPFSPAAAGGAAFVSVGRASDVIVGTVGNPAAPVSFNRVVLTYINLGRARLNGLDAALRWRALERLTLSASAGLTQVDTIELPVGSLLTTPATANARRELTQLNSPRARAGGGVELTDVLPGTSLTLGVRHTTEYPFASGINVGVVPTFTVADLTLAHQLPGGRGQLYLAGNNLFTCTRDLTTDPASPLRVTARRGRCGVDERHVEMVNMPAVGPTAILGMRLTR